MDMLTKKAVPMDLLFKGPEEQKVSKEEENTFILQVFKWKNELTWDLIFYSQGT